MKIELDAYLEDAASIKRAVNWYKCVVCYCEIVHFVQIGAFSSFEYFKFVI